MPILRTLVSMAVRRAATDPQMRAKVVQAARQFGPSAERTGYAIRDAAREASPLEDPRGFLRLLRDRLRPPADR